MMREGCYNGRDSEEGRGDMRAFLKWTLALLVLYIALLAGMLAAMYQPPERFGKIMRHAPGFALMAVPLKPLWLFARAGRLKVGAPAPDFALDTQDKKTRVALSSFRGRQPVVLVFGSYT